MHKLIDLLPIFILLGLGLNQIKPTGSYLSDEIAIQGTTFTVANDWPSPISQGDVIINEIMWMGSSANAADQWLELKNTTDKAIDISGCTLTGVRAGNNSVLIIDPNKTIEANGYFLIVKKEPGNTALADNVGIDLAVHSVNFHNKYDNNGPIILTCDGVEIDQTPEPDGDDWPAGLSENGKHKIFMSMQRNELPDEGWSTCSHVNCTNTNYWKIGDNNYGTPGGKNIFDLTLSLTNFPQKSNFKLKGPKLNQFHSGSFILSYVDDGVSQQVKGTFDVPKKFKSISKDIDLGTCSNKVCIYPKKPTEVKIKVTLHGDVFDRTMETD